MFDRHRHTLSFLLLSGPASIGLLSPGTLEYLLESLVSLYTTHVYTLHLTFNSKDTVK